MITNKNFVIKNILASTPKRNNNIYLVHTQEKYYYFSGVHPREILLFFNRNFTLVNRFLYFQEEQNNISYI